MDYYTTCPRCGAHLDPGETCTCELKNEEDTTMSNMTKGSAPMAGTTEAHKATGDSTPTNIFSISQRTIDCNPALCPFCGSPAVLHHSNYLNLPSVRMFCTVCHVGTLPVTYGGKSVEWDKTDWCCFERTEDEAIAEVTRIWNKRKTDVRSEKMSDYVRL